jgi:hypothetical protein
MMAFPKLKTQMLDRATPLIPAKEDDDDWKESIVEPVLDEE